MFRRYQWVLVAAAAGFFLGGGSGGLAQRTGTDNLADDPRKLDQEVARMKWDANLDKVSLRDLQRAKREAAQNHYDARFREFAAGKALVADFLLASGVKLLAAELDLAQDNEQRLQALERYWVLAKKAELIQEAKFKAGTTGPADYYDVVYSRLDVEVEIVRLKQAMAKKKEG